MKWLKSWGGPQRDDSYAVCRDGAGNLLITGAFTDSLQIGSTKLISSGSQDIYLAKFDAEGANLWALKMGAQFSNDVGKRIIADAAGNIYVSGIFSRTVDFDPGPAIVNVTAKGGQDVFLCKFDPAGNFRWVTTIGGIQADEISDMILDPRGFIYVGGGFQGTVDFDPGPLTDNRTAKGYEDMYLCKFDTSGKYGSVHTFGSNHPFIGERATGLACDPSGNIYMAGYFLDTVSLTIDGTVRSLVSNGSVDILLLKMDSEGKYLWVKHIGGAVAESVTSLDCDVHGNTYMAGNFTGAVNFNPGAVPEIHTSIGYTDAFLLKSGPDGSLGWVRTFAGPLDKMINSVKVANSGNIYIAGYFNDTAYFDQQRLVYRVSTGGLDIFLAGMDADGRLSWVKSLAGTPTPFSNDYCNSMALDPQENIYATGTFQGTLNLTPELPDNVVSKGNTDIFLLKIARNSEPLPLTDLKFTGECTPESAIRLNWQFTAPVHQDSRFEIEYSTDGKHFSPLHAGKVITKGSLPADHTYTDRRPAGTHPKYYRLKITNDREQYFNSEVLKVRPCEEWPAISVYPNPVDQTLFFSGPYPLTITITTVDGRLIRRLYQQRERMETGFLAPGIYLLRLEDEATGLRQTINLVKK